MSLLFFILYVTPGNFVDRIAPFAPREMKEDVANYWGVGEPLGQCLIFLKNMFTLSAEPLPGRGNAFHIVGFLLPFTLIFFTAGVVLSYSLGVVLSRLLKMGSQRNPVYIIAGGYLVPVAVLGIFFKWLLIFHWRIFPPVGIDVIETFPSSPWNLFHGAVTHTITQAELLKSVLPGMGLPLVILVAIGVTRVVFSRIGAEGESRLIPRRSTPMSTTMIVGMLSGTLVLEYIFQWPGIGYILFETIKMSDYLLTSACIFALAWVVVISCGVADVLQYVNRQRSKDGIKNKEEKEPGKEIDAKIEHSKKFMSKKGIIGMCMVLTAVFLAVAAPYIIILDPLSGYAEPGYIHNPPCKSYPFGTDIMGRDIYSQVIWGFRTAVTIAGCTCAVTGIVGILAGVAGGLSRGIPDTLSNQVTTIFLVWPQIPLAALIVYALEDHYQFAVIIAASAVLWPITSQAVRAEVIYVKSRHSGITSYLSAVRVILVYMPITAAASLIVTNTLDFLGMGDPLVMSWGQMLSLTMMGRGALAGWWTIVFPGVALTYMVISLFLLSYAAKDVGHN